MNAILQFDSAILLWIQEHVRAALATPAVTFITHLGDRGQFWIALALLLLCFRRARKIGLACCVSMLLGLLLTDGILKHLVARTRPYELIPGLERLIEKQHDFSFPSGHTTNSLACGWVIFRMAPKKLGVPALILAVLIALSRLYVGVHYPTDVLGGTIVGITCACVAMPLSKWLLKRFPAAWRNWFE